MVATNLGLLTVVWLCFLTASIPVALCFWVGIINPRTLQTRVEAMWLLLFAAFLATHPWVTSVGPLEATIAVVACVMVAYLAIEHLWREWRQLMPSTME